MPRTSFITISYAPDFERCKRLCESFDKFVEGYQHLIYCPKDHLDLFKELEAPHRKIATYQDILPGRYLKIPFTKKWWLDPTFFPVRGWILQQLLKIASAAMSDSEDVYFLDSDIVFFKNFDPQILLEDGKTRLYALKTAAPTEEHVAWQSLAERLLDLPHETFHTDYIGPVLSWKTENVRAMVKRIESVTKKPWHIALGHSYTFSEYLLYGNFVERILKQENGHTPRDYLLCWNIWGTKELNLAKNNNINIPEETCSILVQSNLRMNIDEENAILDKLIGR